MAEKSEERTRNYQGLAAVGPVPTAAFPRWARWVQAPQDGLPPVKEYRCRRTRESMTIDGRLDEKAWRKVTWSEPFGAIATGAAVEFALPWEGLAPLMNERPVPPRPGDELRITAYRAHHTRKERNRRNTSTGWTWSVMGNDNIHVPERWNRVLFTDETVQAPI